MAAKKIIVKGKVQGVFFRATAKTVADELGIKGTIKNSADGNVEIVAAGSDEQLEKFMKWCNKGPNGADVKDVSVVNHEEQYFAEFKILH